MDDDILITVKASVPRRAMGVGVLGLLGVILIAVALFQAPANPALRVYLLGFGLGALWLARRMWLGTRHRLELTKTQLRSSDGSEIARVSDIRSLESGIFASKPSNGFLLRLNGKTPVRFSPGFWWSFGSRVGVGGVTSAPQTKAMAEVISAMIADRN